MILIVALSIAILFFLTLYARTITEYFTLLRAVEPIISGRYKTGLLYSSIQLEGTYKERKVVCGLEQLKQGGDALFVKIRLKGAPEPNLSLKDSRFSKKVVLSGGWIMPKYYIAKDSFNRTHFIETLDKLSHICDVIELQSGGGIQYDPGGKMHYRADQKRDSGPEPKR